MFSAPFGFVRRFFRVDYYTSTADNQLSYLSDMWALHIMNTGFQWNKVSSGVPFLVAVGRGGGGVPLFPLDRSRMTIDP